MIVKINKVPQVVFIEALIRVFNELQGNNLIQRKEQSKSPSVAYTPKD